MMQSSRYWIFSRILDLGEPNPIDLAIKEIGQ